jgi:NADPH:quinone reductase-like Zn-dependent oxidoreductase
MFLAFIFISILSPRTKVPFNISYDQAGGLPSAIGAAYLGLYNLKPDGLGFTTPLDDNGRGKYNNTPLLIFGGATNVGQYGTWSQGLYSIFMAKNYP